eukprot:3776811-Rhodomonas_salina.1
MERTLNCILLQHWPTIKTSLVAISKAKLDTHSLQDWDSLDRSKEQARKKCSPLNRRERKRKRARRKRARESERKRKRDNMVPPSQPFFVESSHLPRPVSSLPLLSCGFLSCFAPLPRKEHAKPSVRHVTDHPFKQNVALPAPVSYSFA